MFSHGELFCTPPNISVSFTAKQCRSAQVHNWSRLYFRTLRRYLSPWCCIMLVHPQVISWLLFKKVIFNVLKQSSRLRTIFGVNLSFNSNTYKKEQFILMLKSCIMEWGRLQIGSCIASLWVLGGKSFRFVGALCWMEPALQLIRHIVLQVETCKLTWKGDKAFVLLWVWLKQTLPAFTWQKCNLSCVTQITAVYPQREQDPCLGVAWGGKTHTHTKTHRSLL